jgi:hypothetical protein
MNQPKRIQLKSNEANVNMAIQAIEMDQFRSNRSAAKVFKVSRRTLDRRRIGVPVRHDCAPNSKNLTELEEDVIIDHALDLDMRGFQLTYDMLREMADKLLTDRGARRVGVNWPSRFVDRKKELKLRVNRKYDYQRALNEDPEIIKGWFRLVANTKAKYGILDEDMYNFDEAGFQMGVIGSRMVITGSERLQAPKSIQPGNTEWVTTIVAANAHGWAIPPFVILKGAQQYDTWHDAIADRPGWILSVSEKGWTSLEHGFKWLKHFDSCTVSRTTGVYRLLVMDGHDSHNTMEFREYCKEHKIVTLCMPPHSSHLLQPLDVGCFGPLKRAYSKEIESFVRCRINHITKEDFLPAFKAAFANAINEDNIRGGFRGAGLLPFDPEAVISKLEVRLRTPSLPPTETPHWESQTPRNLTEIESQTQYMIQRIQRHQNSSPTSIFGGLESLEKGVKIIAHGASIMEAEIGRLRTANALLSKRKSRKRKVLKGVNTISVADGVKLNEQRSVAESAAARNRSAPKQRRCGRCREPGHRIETCKMAPIDVPSNEDHIVVVTE